MSNIYTIKCTNHEQPVDFTYSVKSDQWLLGCVDAVYVFCKDMASGKNVRINYVKCPDCHTSSSANLRIVGEEKGE